MNRSFPGTPLLAIPGGQLPAGHLTEDRDSASLSPAALQGNLFGPDRKALTAAVLVLPSAAQASRAGARSVDSKLTE